MQFDTPSPDDALGTCCHVDYAKLPDGVAEAWDEREVRVHDPDPRRILDPDYGSGWFTVINRTLEPGTPVEMCVSYNNNENTTRCEDTAVAQQLWASGFTSLIVQVDIDAPQSQLHRFKGVS